MNQSHSMAHPRDPLHGITLETIVTTWNDGKTTMQLQSTIQDGHVWITDEAQTLHIELQQLKG